MNIVPLERRGRREDRVRAAPAVSCARCTSKNAHEHTGSAETLRPSPRNGFTAYSALSSVTGLFCHRRPREALASQELDTSVGVSGPHDFAVRARLRSSFASIRVHRIPPHVRDDREPPLSSGETARAGSADLPDEESGIFFVRGLDRISVICPSGSFRLTLAEALPQLSRFALTKSFTENA